MSLSPTMNSRLVGMAVLAFAIADGALIALGLILTPTTLTASHQGPLGVAAASVMLAVYGVLGVAGSPAVERRNVRILPTASLFGLAIGTIFVAEMLFEYAFLPGSKENQALAYLEFGGMCLCLLLAGFKGGFETGKVWEGVLTAIWSAMIGLLIWAGSLLSTYYAFRGTARQEQVLAADQVFEDFKRSGMTDRQAFVMQDYLGGVFFHLLLGLIVAGIHGLIGALAGRLFAFKRSEKGGIAGT